LIDYQKLPTKYEQEACCLHLDNTEAWQDKTSCAGLTNAQQGFPSRRETTTGNSQLPISKPEHRL